MRLFDEFPETGPGLFENCWFSIRLHFIPHRTELLPHDCPEY
jgi:hypothetical protein